MALCHDVTIDHSHGKPTYTSASPDELAFVDFAKECGMNYYDKTTEDIVVLHNTVAGGELKEEYYKLEGICEFTSDRRISSNIYKVDGKYVIYTKGADSAVEGCLRSDTD
jgi:phospholipid-translocating ATPase